MSHFHASYPSIFPIRPTESMLTLLAFVYFVAFKHYTGCIFEKNSLTLKFNLSHLYCTAVFYGMHIYVWN